MLVVMWLLGHHVTYLDVICIVLFFVFVLYLSFVTVEPGYNDIG